MTAFLMLNCCSPPQSFHDSSPQGGALKASPLGEVARSDGVAAKRTLWCRSLRSVCDFRATDDRPYKQYLPRFLELNALSHTK